MRPLRDERTGTARPTRIRGRTTGLVAALAVALATALPATVMADDAAPPGLRIADGQLVEADGSRLVLRGVNHAHTWYPQHTQAFADISALGANAVRTVLSSGDRWTRNDVDDVRAVIRLASEAQMISVLEVHDTTGYGEEGAAASLAQATDYWISIKDAVIGREDRVLVNIGNEPFGNDESANARYVPDTIAAIQRLRDAGIRNTIVVDAPNWGQDWSGTMRDNAAQIFAADPDANVLFSVHMYGVYEQAGAIRAYLDAFETAGLPLIIGEFGHTHSDGEVDEDTILRETRARGIGWLGWSWSGNSGGVEYLDLAQDFDPNRLSPWGQRLFNGPDGIAETSVRAAVFSDGQPGPDPDPGPGPDPDPGPTPDPDPGPSPDPGPEPNPDPDPSAVCAADYRTLNSWPGGFQGEVVVTSSSAATLTGWQVSWAFPGGQSVTQAWNARLAQEGTAVSADDVGYNATVQPGSSTAFGFIGTGEAPTSVAVTCGGTGSTG